MRREGKVWKARGESCLLESQSVPSESRLCTGCRFISRVANWGDGRAGSGGGSRLCFLLDRL